MSMQQSHKPKLERVPPRRRKPKRSVWKKVVWPIVLYTSVACFAFFLVNRIAKPFKLYNREIRETRRLEMELEAYQKSNVALQRQMKYLQTPEGAAQAARKLGWVKPDEITLVLPPENEKKSAE